jgi:hypothetical protein
MLANQHRGPHWNFAFVVSRRNDTDKAITLGGYGGNKSGRVWIVVERPSKFSNGGVDRANRRIRLPRLAR